MQNTYKKLTATAICKRMVPADTEPATYCIVIRDVEYMVNAHRDTVEMANGTMGSTLVLSTPDERIVLRWSGQPDSILSTTVQR